MLVCVDSLGEARLAPFQGCLGSLPRGFFWAAGWYPIRLRSLLVYDQYEIFGLKK